MSQSCDEEYDVNHKRKLVARTQYECDACDIPIAAGSEYFRIGVVFDGTAETWKRCVRCEALHAHLVDKCREYNRANDESMYPREALDCGLHYEEEWGAVPAHIAALAFWLPGDPLPSEAAKQ